MSAGPSTLWQLTGSTLDSTDRVGQPPQVEIKETTGNAPSTISVAPDQREYLSLPGGPGSAVSFGARRVAGPTIDSMVPRGGT